MGPLTIRGRTGNGADALVRRAKVAAETGDRLFLSTAQRLAGIGRWAKSEMRIACESARAAWATTQKLTLGTPSRRRTRPREPSFTGIDVVSAIENDRSPSGHALPANAGRRPRVPLLLRLLGDVVSEYEGRGYEGLQGDERFWNLVGLLERTRTDEVRARTEYGET